MTTQYKKLSIRQIKTIAKAIHKQVFNNFTYQTDMEQYGIDEKWVMPEPNYDGSQKFTGDCEDFSLACRKLIREAGIKSRLVYCIDETGEGHCVLEAHGYILDNRQHSLVTNKYLVRKKYQFIALSGYESGEPWKKIINIKK